MLTTYFIEGDVPTIKTIKDESQKWIEVKTKSQHVMHILYMRIFRIQSATGFAAVPKKAQSNALI